MRNEPILRHAALVSYGTQFLRKEITLEDWYQHGIFWGTRLQFHRLEDNALLADDFTLWLGILAQSGATRLSLHMLAQFDVPELPAMAPDDYAVAVHYPDHYEIWAIPQRTPEWIKHPLFPKGQGVPIPAFPDATRHGGNLDNYWYVSSRPGALPVPETNWKELAAAIARDLDINMPLSDVKSGPFYGPVSEQCHARMPLIARSPAVSLANWILSSLGHKQGWFDNDMHHHNDNGSYARASSDEEVDQLYDWGARLDSWTIEALIRAANETRIMAVFSNEPPLVRIHPPALKDARMEALAEQSGPTPDVAASPQTDASVAARPFSWIRAIALLLAAIVLSVIIYYAAGMIAGHPWSAALVGVPLALYLKYRK